MLDILYVEIVSQPLLAAAALILQMTRAETAQWFGISFVMHLVYGLVLGLAVRYRLRAVCNIYAITLEVRGRDSALFLVVCMLLDTLHALAACEAVSQHWAVAAGAEQKVRWHAAVPGPW